MTERQPHPHFDDRGTLSWFETLQGAQAAAQEQGRLIFIEFGRKA